MRRASATTTALGLAVLATLALVAPARAQQEAGEPGAAGDAARLVQVKILGMSCPFCAYGAEQKLKELEGVKGLEVELKTGIATLTMEEDADVANEKLKETVDDAGFEAVAIVRSFDSEHEDWNPEKLRTGGESGASRAAGRR